MDFTEEPAAEQPENTQPANESSEQSTPPTPPVKPAPDAQVIAATALRNAMLAAERKARKEGSMPPKEEKAKRVVVMQELGLRFNFFKDEGSGRRYYGPAGTNEPFLYKLFTLTDDTINGICLDLSMANVSNSRQLVQEVICTPQVSRPINLAQEQLDYLEQHYDGRDHLAELIACCTTDSPPLFRAMFTKWLVSVVAQVFDTSRRNEYAFVFVGAQGCGKTGFFERLLWHRQHYVAPATAFTFSNKEHMLLLTSHVLILLDEMSAYGKKTDLDQLKAAFSLSEVTTDKKYQEAGTYPRRGSFAGTTNKQDFLRDVTGDRRFLVFELEKYDQDRFNAIDKRQLWGQLTRMYKRGFQTRLTSAEIEVNMARNTDSFSMEKTEDYFIEQHFVVTENDKHFVSNRQMFYLIDTFNKDLSGKTFGIGRSTVAALLKRRGVQTNVQGRDGGVNSRGFRGLQLLDNWIRDNPVDIKAEADTGLFADEMQAQPHVKSDTGEQFKLGVTPEQIQELHKKRDLERKAASDSMKKREANSEPAEDGDAAQTTPPASGDEAIDPHAELDTV
jgi:hypothetical protein